MIISRSYFNVDFDIAHTSDASAPNSNLVGKRTELDDFIKRYEKRILTKVFGFPLYNEFMSKFDYNSSTFAHTLNVGVEAKWDDLLNGKTYTLKNVQVDWPGILTTDEALPTSFISDAVYAQFLKHDQSKYMGVGLVTHKAKNATRADASSKYVQAWNEFVELVVGKYCFDSDNSDIGNGVRSLYQFIEDMNTLTPGTYLNWLPYEFKPINIFGI